MTMPTIDDDLERAIAREVAVFFYECQGGERDDAPEPNEGDQALASHIAAMLRRFNINEEGTMIPIFTRNPDKWRFIDQETREVWRWDNGHYRLAGVAMSAQMKGK